MSAARVFGFHQLFAGTIAARYKPGIGWLQGVERNNSKGIADQQAAPLPVLFLSAVSSLHGPKGTQRMLK